MASTVLAMEFFEHEAASYYSGVIGTMNIDRYKNDLDALLAKGAGLHNGIQYECDSQEFARAAKSSLGEKAEGFLQALPSFKNEYQPWYSEAKALVRLLLPDRLADFARHYEKPKPRKDITYENYTIEDYLQEISVTRTVGITVSTIVGPDAVIPRFNQQLSIVKSIRERFRSSLFDIRQLAQADLFDSELEVAKELANKKFTRAAGAVAGVVLERHLKEVCGNHGVTIRKKNPQISDLNESLKGADVVDIPQWRSIQYLGDLRNLCAHDKKPEPTMDQVEDLLAGVAKVTKTIF